MKRLTFMSIALLILACCISTATIAAEKKTLTVISPWKVKSLDLGKSGFLFARMGCLEMLTTTDDNGNVVGFLAESWNVSPDKLTWTFKLRPNITFHDKTPLTARAVAKSLNISLKNKGVLTKAKIAKITPVEPLTLQIRTTEPFSSLPAHLAHFSAGIVSETSFDENDKIITIYGTGQYIFTGEQGKTLFRCNQRSKNLQKQRIKPRTNNAAQTSAYQEIPTTDFLRPSPAIF